MGHDMSRWGAFAANALMPAAGPDNAAKVHLAVQKLRATQGSLEQRQTSMDTQIANFMARALHARDRNDRAGALYHLRLKRMYEAERLKVEKLVFTIERQILALESGNMLMVTVSSIRDATSSMTKNLNADIEQIETLADDLSDLTATADEITRAISTSSTQDDFDEDELARELDALEPLPALPPAPPPALPPAPTTALPADAPGSAARADARPDAGRPMARA